MITHSKSVPGNVIDIFLKKHDAFITYVENNMDGLRFLNETPFGFGSDDCLIAIDGVDIRKKSKDDIIKLLNKDKAYDYSDIYQLTVLRKSHPDQSTIIVGNTQVQDYSFIKLFLQMQFLFRFHQQMKNVDFVICAMQ